MYTNINIKREEEKKFKIKKDDDEKKFNEWLAGVIDANGSLTVYKDGYVSLEITMRSNDFATLMLIKNKLGGSVTLRAGVKTYRYRLHNKAGIIDLIHRINGNVRNSMRLIALKKACTFLKIPYISPIELSINSSWYSGFFDADGSISINFQPSSNIQVTPIITISVTNKYKMNIDPFLIFKGNIYFDKSGYGHYIWSISNKKDILNILEYFKKNPIRSCKLARLKSIYRFYKLKDLKAHQQPINTPLYNSWLSFKWKWNKFY